MDKDEEQQPVPERPATWENEVVGEVEKAVGHLLHNPGMEEEGADQLEAAREVQEEFRREHHRD